MTLPTCPPLRHIVAATDLSPAAAHAAERAAELAQLRGARLTLLHAVAPGLLDELRRWAGDESPAQAIEADAQQRLQGLAAQLRRRWRVEVDASLLTGAALPQITAALAQCQGDLVVAGAHGAGFVRNALIGSTAERLAQRAGTPVLVARQGLQGPYRRVLVPVDFSPWSALALQLAAQVAPGAAVVLMHAVEVPFEGRMRLAGVADEALLRYRAHALAEARSRLQQLAAQAGLGGENVQLSTPGGADPWMLIAREESEHDCDLIVIGRQGRHALDELLLGSTTRMVLAECRADVLVSVQRAAAAA